MEIKTDQEALDMLESLKKYLQDPAYMKPIVSRTPPGITFSMTGGIRYKDQLLRYDRGMWIVECRDISQRGVSGKLTPCERQDLSPGDIAFMTYNYYAKYIDLNDYFLVISDVEQVHWVDGSVCLSDKQFTYYYKVEIG